MKLTRKISLIISYAAVILLVLIDQLTKYLAVTNEQLLNDYGYKIYHKF